MTTLGVWRQGGSEMSRAEQLFGIDSRSLTAFRIGLGGLVLADLAYRALDFRAHYTDAGVLPRALYLEIFSQVEITWSLHLLQVGNAYGFSRGLVSFVGVPTGTSLYRSFSICSPSLSR